jgi:hypothetical protein
MFPDLDSGEYERLTELVLSENFEKFKNSLKFDEKLSKLGISRKNVETIERARAHLEKQMPQGKSFSFASYWDKNPGKDFHDSIFGTDCYQCCEY